MDFLPLLAGSSREPVPAADALSTLITSAPRSAKIIPQNGPGPIPAISTIFNPFRGPILISCNFFFPQWLKIKNQLG